ncbi:hypothetical protein ACQ86D_27675 [Streptomyces galilaeus]
MKLTVVNALVALGVACVGAGWAYAVHKQWLLLAVPVPLVLITLGEATFRWGKRRIKTAPTASVKWMQFRFLMYLSVATVGSGLAILGAAALAPDKNADAETKEIFTALGGAVGTALAAVFVGGRDNPWENWLDIPIKKAFQTEYKGFWLPDSLPRDAVFADVFQDHEGWGRRARKARAEVIATALKAGTDRAPAAVIPGVAPAGGTIG